MNNKRFILLCTFALAACGGAGGSNPTPIGKAVGTTPVTAGTTTMSVSFLIPDTTTTVGSASTVRTPQYVAPETSFLFFDLQNNANPVFDNTFTVDSNHCTGGSSGNVCTFTATVPAGDTTTLRWSIAAGAGQPDGSTGTPLSVAHTVQACYPFPCQAGTVNVRAYLNAVVTDIFKAGLDWFFAAAIYPSGGIAVPWFTLTPMDAFGNTVRGSYGSNAPINSTGFENPFTLSVDDGAAGEVLLEQIVGLAPGPALVPPLFSSQTFSMLANLHGGVQGIALIDNATITRTFNINYSIPAITLQPSEFPQLTKPWTSPAKSGTIMTVQCVPPAQAPTGPNPNPCSEIFP
jgi:hypothetical protein